MRRDLGLLAPPLLLHSPIPTLLAAAWAVLRETVLVDGELPRSKKECAAVAISRTNRCPYCVDAHSVALHSLGQGQLVRRLRAGQGASSDLAPFLAWAESSREPDAELVRKPPFPPTHRAEAIGTALAFHYINRMVTPLLPESVLPAPARLLRGPLLALAGRWLAPPRGRRLAPGEALSFLASPDHARAPSWAAGAPAIARAFAALDQATEEAMAKLLGPARRHALAGRLHAWRGEEPALGTAWLEEPLAGWNPGEAAAGRLALLAALAPHRITAGEIERFRTHHPGDAPLIAALAWGSYEAARRISEWLTG